MTDYNAGTVAVGTTATYIGTFPITGIEQPAGPGALIKNNGPVTVFLGGATNVAVGDNSGESLGGFELEPGEKILLPASGTTQYDLYGITADGTAYVAYLGA